MEDKNQIAYCGFATFPRRTTGPLSNTLSETTVTRESATGRVVRDFQRTREERLPETVARRSGCPLADRRPVAGTDHSARGGHLKASNPGRSGDTHSSLQAALRPEPSIA